MVTFYIYLYLQWPGKRRQDVSECAFTKTHKWKHPVLSRFICEKGFGRLGNQMFSFASAYGIAAYLNRTIVVDNSRCLHKMFTLDAIVVDKCVCHEAKPKVAKKHCSFDKNLFNMTLENYRVGLYLQSWRYFEDVVPQIRNQFTFKRIVYDKARKVMTKIKADFDKNKQTGVKTKPLERNITFVGVHIRRGDLLTKHYLKFGYQVAPKQYIDKAMMFFTERFKDVLFLVCSDSMNWTAENVKHQHVVHVRGNSPEVDLSILSQCNHTIITVGTYGWWAGFLAGGITLYYKHPAREDSLLRREFSKDYSDFFYPGWIGME